MAIIKSFRIKSFKNLNSIIEFENVSLSYDNRLILDNISFKVNQGQIYGMLGPNGVGKSTIFNLITGLIKPSSGNIKINGEIANNLNARLIRDGNVLYTGAINSIFREKNAAKQVAAGLECGITLKDFSDFKEKDVIEVYKVIETERRI